MDSSSHNHQDINKVNKALEDNRAIRKKINRKQRDSQFDRAREEWEEWEKERDNALKKRQQTDPWKQEAVICFDGGGIRGYGSLKILGKLIEQIEIEEKKQLEERDKCGKLEKDRKFLPAHYFDYFYRTSTGGLIAIMLSRWRMSVDESLDAYKEFSKNIFGRKSRRPFPYPYIPLVPTYNETGLCKSINDMVERKTPMEVLQDKTNKKKISVFTQLPAPPDLCKVGVLCFNQWDIATMGRFLRTFKSEAPTFLRSYKPHENVSLSEPQTDEERNAIDRFQLLLPEQFLIDDISILTACRATSAAPGYLKPEKYIPNPKDNDNRSTKTKRFIDGGVGANNPTLYVWKEVESQIRDGNRRGHCPYIVSIGTGQSKSRGRSIVDKLPLLNDRAKDRICEHLLADTEAVHKKMKQEIGEGEAKIKKGHYYRFNVGEELGELPMASVKEKDYRRDGSKCSPFTYMNELVDDEYREKEKSGEKGKSREKEKSEEMGKSGEKEESGEIGESGESDDEGINGIKRLAKKLVENRIGREIKNNRECKAWWERYQDCVTFHCGEGIDSCRKPVKEEWKYKSRKSFQHEYTSREEVRCHLNLHLDTNQVPDDASFTDLQIFDRWKCGPQFKSQEEGTIWKGPW